MRCFFNRTRPQGGLTLLLLLALGLTACQSAVKNPGQQLLRERQSQSLAHPAAYTTDLFFVDVDRDEKEVKKQDFFFQRCEVVSRKRYPGRAEYECDSPFSSN